MKKIGRKEKKHYIIFAKSFKRKSPETISIDLKEIEKALSNPPNEA